MLADLMKLHESIMDDFEEAAKSEKDNSQTKVNMYFDNLNVEPVTFSECIRSIPPDYEIVKTVINGEVRSESLNELSVKYGRDIVKNYTLYNRTLEVVI